MKSIRASATFAPAAAIGWPISPAHRCTPMAVMYDD